MPKPPIRIPDAELAVLEVLWGDGARTIREIADVLYPGGATSHYATVQKLLERLERRECVGRRREGRAHIFSARVARKEFIRDRLREAANRFCGGRVAPLLTHLVEAGDLTATELRELRELVDRLGGEDGGNEEAAKGGAS